MFPEDFDLGPAIPNADRDDDREALKTDGLISLMIHLNPFRPDTEEFDQWMDGFRPADGTGRGTASEFHMSAAI